MNLEKLQSNFFSYLASTEKKSEDWHQVFNCEEKIERLSVYQNNYFASLNEVLTDIFPSIVKLVGEDFFKALAQKYWQAQPPSSSVLLTTAESFPSFLQEEPTLQTLPYIADIARLDYFYNQTYYAHEQEAVTAETLSEIPPTELAEHQLELQRSLIIFESKFAIFDVWQWHSSNDENSANNTSGSEQEHISYDEQQTVLLFQHQNTVEIFNIDPAFQKFLVTLQSGASLNEALHSAVEVDCEFNATEAVSFLVSYQLIVSVKHI